MRVERGERHELYLAVGAVVRVRRVHHHLVALLYLLFSMRYLLMTIESRIAYKTVPANSAQTHGRMFYSYVSETR